MGSTTQYDERRFYPHRAKKLIDARKWSDALEECEGLLNGRDRSHFERSADIWVSHAVALLWLGRVDEAEHSFEVAHGESMVGSMKELEPWFLRHSLEYRTQAGHVPQADQIALQLAEDTPTGSAWVSMCGGRVRLNASRFIVSRNRRDHMLKSAADCFGSAYNIWSSDAEQASLATRTECLRLWFASIANQSNGVRSSKEVKEVLDKVNLIDADLAAKLRKELRMRKYFGTRL